MHLLSEGERKEEMSLPGARFLSSLSVRSAAPTWFTTSCRIAISMTNGAGADEGGPPPPGGGGGANASIGIDVERRLTVGNSSASVGDAQRRRYFILNDVRVRIDAGTARQFDG